MTTEGGQPDMVYSLGTFDPSLAATGSTYQPMDIVDLDAEIIPPLHTPVLPTPDWMMTKEEIEEVFEVRLPEDINILVACIDSGSYEETAFILFDLWGVLFEVNAFHCSCYEFDGQWKPEPAIPDALRMRDFDGDQQLKARVLEVLEQWESQR